MFAVLLYILVIVLAVAIVVVSYASRQSDHFSVKRSAQINAPPATIFALIDDFRQWAKWSPWDNLDPSMAKTMSGADSGIGAIYEWSGDKKVGAGRMEILNSVPPSRVEIKLSFLKPFKAENLTVFTIAPSGAGATVVWEMTGSRNLMLKIVGLVMNMDKIVGGDFEKGLAAIKAEAEAPPV